MRNQAIAVRQANESDTDAVAAVTASALQTLRRVYRPTDAAAARREQTAPRRHRLVAHVDGEVCGTVEYHFEDDRLHLMGLAVSFTHRRNGVARSLLEHLADLAAAAGKKRLSLYSVRQTGNVAIFERMGFRVIREEPAIDLVSDTAAELTEVFMMRAL